MELIHAGLVGYAGAAVAYGLLGLAVIYWWNRTLSGAILLAATLATMAWSIATAVDLYAGSLNGQIASVLEIVRNCVWLLLPLSLLTWVQPARRASSAAALVAFCVGLAALTLLFEDASGTFGGANTNRLIVIAGHLLLSLVGLALIENLLRNSSKEHAWSIKYLCFGMGAIFAYDFFLYSDALLFRRLDPGLFLARGITSLLAMPLFVVHVTRVRMAGPQITMSRQFVFHTATLVSAGLYLMVMAAAGYYVRQVGGTWSTFLQAVFFFGALLLLILPVASATFRAYLRVLIEKSFFQYKYDYRREWLRFIQTISNIEEQPDLRRRVIRAVCDIVDSPEGALWVQ